MLDERGFHTKRYEEMIDEVNAEAKEKFGPDVNLSERTPLGIILRIFAWFMSLVYKVVQDVYYAAYIDTAHGIQLDRKVADYNITRFTARKSSVTCTVKGTLGAMVPTGMRASTTSEIYFETRQIYTISDPDPDDETGKMGICDIEMYAVEPGVSGNVDAGLITNLVNPIESIREITNKLPATGGREEETDQELRSRFKLSRGKNGKATISSIRAGILSVPGVRAATVVENYTMETVDGNPPKSVHAYVLGGEEADIAAAILDYKAGGIEPYGDVYVDVEDISGRMHRIGFSRAVPVILMMKVRLTVNMDFSTANINTVKSMLVQAVGGTDLDGTSYAGLSMGRNVIQAKLVSLVFDVDGVEDVALEISSDGGHTYSTGNVTIDQYQVAQVDATQIEVSVDAK